MTQFFILKRIEMISQKYGTKDDTNTIIYLPLSRDVIANYLGVARETVSRKFSQIKIEELIYSINNKEILIPDMGKIEAIALN